MEGKLAYSLNTQAQSPPRMCVSRLTAGYKRNPFRFSTKYHDAATKLYYYGYRYYSPDYGRFISQDPIRESGGLNIYAFVNNNPTNYYDYLGMFSNLGMAVGVAADYVSSLDLGSNSYDYGSYGGSYSSTFLNYGVGGYGYTSFDFYTVNYAPIRGPETQIGSLGLLPESYYFDSPGNSYDWLWNPTVNGVLSSYGIQTGDIALNSNIDAIRALTPSETESLVFMMGRLPYSAGGRGIFGGELTENQAYGLNKNMLNFEVYKNSDNGKLLDAYTAGMTVLTEFQVDVSTGIGLFSLGKASAQALTYSSTRTFGAFDSYTVNRGLNTSDEVYGGVREASEYLQSIGVSRAERVRIIQSFDIQTIKVGTAGDNMYGIRFHDFGENARPVGQYLFETFGNLTNRNNLAVPIQWNNFTGVSQFQIQPGTTFLRGAVAPQTQFGTQYIGGADQIFIYKPWQSGALIEP